MLQVEYVRNLNCNYERILLDRKPEENRYQYCILNRGEVRGLLPCSLRYINGTAYLYYDISSRQNVSHLYSSRCINREWVRDFVWSLKQIQMELGRFLLDAGNILWYPEHIFQDLESNEFSFLYVPYYEGEPSFIKLLEFWVEHIDYADEELVECVYRMYERVERNGEVYLQSHIFTDIECLECKKEQDSACAVPAVSGGTSAGETGVIVPVAVPLDVSAKEQMPEETAADRKKKGILGLFDGKRSRDRKMREEYRQSMQEVMAGRMVAEETSYAGAPYGQTIYVEKKQTDMEQVHRVYTPEGRVLANLTQQTLSIGKKKGEVALVLDDVSVSRIHARITEEKGVCYLEDLNSTNGTYKNNVRLQPYERQKLMEGDEIRCGNTVVIFR